MSLDICKKTFNNFKETHNFFSTEFKNIYDQTQDHIYISSYNYNDDFTGRPDFVNSNYVRGLTQNQKLCENRKYVFASFVLVNDNGVKKLFGYWIFRHIQPSSETIDTIYEDNTWEKLECDDTNLTKLDNAFHNLSTFDNKTVLSRFLFI